MEHQWRELSAKDTPRSGNVDDIAKVHERLQAFHDRFQEIQQQIGEHCDDLDGLQAAIVDIRNRPVAPDQHDFSPAIAEARKEFADRHKAISDTMTEVLKKTAFDQEAVKREFKDRQSAIQAQVTTLAGQQAKLASFVEAESKKWRQPLVTVVPDPTPPPPPAPIPPCTPWWMYAAHIVTAIASIAALVLHFV